MREVKWEMWDKSAIYISFSGKRRHEELLALIAVHELSHALWEKIEGRPIHRIWFKSKTEHDKFALFAEGFAVFAHETWFLDIYPPSVKQMIAQMGWANTDGFHYRGRQRIQELVKQYGPEVFLEIPKRWRSL